MVAPDLQYEPTVAGRPVLVERDGRTTRIVVPMRGPYAPVPPWVGKMDLLSVVVFPLWWLTALTVRTCLRLPKPPRAAFEVTQDRIKLSLWESTAGDARVYEWSRSAVAEARANRYDSGLWINVPGQVKETFLADLPRDSIERLEEALNAALAVERPFAAGENAG